MKNRDTKKAMAGIKVSKNGPYLVAGGLPVGEQVIEVDGEGYSVAWRAGKSQPVKEHYALCRCGGSGNKPFCDGTHLKNHFDGTETAGREPYDATAEVISGPELELADVVELCSFARFCDRAGGIWSLTEASDNPEARQTAIEEGENCPSGRLVVRGKNGEAFEPGFEPSIGLVEDPSQNAVGPLWVRGGVPVESADGVAYEVRNRVTLCRCGRSSNKPFCDGSHVAE